MIQTGADGFWQFLGALGGAGISAWTANYNRKKSESFNASQASLQAQRNYKYWRKSLLEGPSLQREGLEAAGYNPMLAINGGMSVPSIAASSAAQTSPNQPDIVGSAREGADLANMISKVFADENRQRKANWMKTKKETELLSTQIKKLEADTKTVTNQEFRNSILDWADRIGDYALPFMFFQMGKGVKSKVPVTPTSKMNPNLFKTIMEKVSPWVLPLLKHSALPAIGIGTASAVINDDKKSYSKHMENNYRNNKYMFSPLR